jgi:hypothetical protein
VYNLVSNKYLFFSFCKALVSDFGGRLSSQTGYSYVGSPPKSSFIHSVAKATGSFSPVDDYTSAFHPGFHPPDCERTAQFAAEDREPKCGLDPVVGDSVQEDDVECDKKLPARPVALDGEMVKSDGKKVCADSKRMFEARKKALGTVVGGASSDSLMGGEKPPILKICTVTKSICYVTTRTQGIKSIFNFDIDRPLENRNEGAALQKVADVDAIEIDAKRGGGNTCDNEDGSSSDSDLSKACEKAISDSDLVKACEEVEDAILGEVFPNLKCSFVVLVKADEDFVTVQQQPGFSSRISFWHHGLLRAVFRKESQAEEFGNKFVTKLLHRYSSLDRMKELHKMNKNPRPVMEEPKVAKERERCLVFGQVLRAESDC